VSSKRKSGSPSTVYANDPLRGNKLEHQIAKLIRANWDHRKIAKRFDVNKRVVDQVADKITR